MRALICAGVMAALALAAGGCATARAKAQPEPPSLDVPAPPPRVIVPPEPEPVPPEETTAKDPEPSQQKPPRRAPQSRPAPPADAGRAQQKTDPPPPVVEAVRPVTPPVATLQQALPTSGEIERQVKEQLAKAGADLERVNYKALSADGRSQYDTAKRFMDQAEQALKEKNLVFATKVAEKAAGLAASLLGR